MFSGKILYFHSRSLYVEISKTSPGEFSHFWYDVDNDDDAAATDNDDDDRVNGWGIWSDAESFG